MGAQAEYQNKKQDGYKRYAQRIFLEPRDDDALQKQLDRMNEALEAKGCPARVYAVYFDIGHQLGLCVEWPE